VNLVLTSYSFYSLALVTTSLCFDLATAGFSFFISVAGIRCVLLVIDFPLALLFSQVLSVRQQEPVPKLRFSRSQFVIVFFIAAEVSVSFWSHRIKRLKFFVCSLCSYNGFSYISIICSMK
jgi:hypothetical protein